MSVFVSGDEIRGWKIVEQKKSQCLLKSGACQTATTTRRNTKPLPSRRTDTKYPNLVELELPTFHGAPRQKNLLKPSSFGGTQIMLGLVSQPASATHRTDFYTLSPLRLLAQLLPRKLRTHACMGKTERMSEGTNARASERAHLVHGDEGRGQEDRQRPRRDRVLQAVPKAHAPRHARTPRRQGGGHVPSRQVEEQTGRVEHVRDTLATTMVFAEESLGRLLGWLRARCATEKTGGRLV